MGPCRVRSIHVRSYSVNHTTSSACIVTPGSRACPCPCWTPVVPISGNQKACTLAQRCSRRTRRKPKGPVHIQRPPRACCFRFAKKPHLRIHRLLCSTCTWRPSSACARGKRKTTLVLTNYGLNLRHEGDVAIFRMSSTVRKQRERSSDVA